MDNFVEKLKGLKVEPKNTSWMKLENRLHEDTYYSEPKKNYRLIFSSIAASVVLIAFTSWYVLNQSYHSLDAKEGFVMEDITNNSSLDDIYNITQLKDLNIAYGFYEDCIF